MARDPSAAVREPGLFAGGKRQRPGGWFLRGRPPVQGVVTLDRRHLYILPTRGGLGFAVVLLAMLLTSLNYNISLGFALTFLLGGIGMACMWLAYRNLLDLAIAADSVAPAYAGQTAVFALRVDNPAPEARIGVDVAVSAIDGVPVASVTLDSAASGTLALHVPARQRGHLALPRVTISSRFPFGLFRVWSYADLGLSALVYPAPEAGAPPLPQLAHSDADEDGSPAAGTIDDGIDQLRRYRNGDPLHRIAWKHSARTGRWMSRAGEPPRQPACWLDWNMLPGAMDTEARLSRLCAWVLAAGDAAEIGLRLPGVEIPQGRGVSHRRACLEALALWPERTRQGRRAPDGARSAP